MSRPGSAPMKGSDPHQSVLEAALATPTQHVPRLVTTHHIREKMHHGNPIGRFNSRFGLLVTQSVGTMWAAYLFALLSLISFPQALAAFMKGDRVTGISWLSQAFLQLVLLPIIIVGQNVISAAQDARAEADHETITALHTINVRQLQLLEEQAKIMAMLQKRAE